MCFLILVHEKLHNYIINAGSIVKLESIGGLIDHGIAEYRRTAV